MVEVPEESALVMKKRRLRECSVSECTAQVGQIVTYRRKKVKVIVYRSHDSIGCKDAPISTIFCWFDIGGLLHSGQRTAYRRSGCSRGSRDLISHCPGWESMEYGNCSDCETIQEGDVAFSYRTLGNLSRRSRIRGRSSPFSQSARRQQCA